MRILLTGANGYIGKRLLPVLLEQGHEVTCAVRNKNRLLSSYIKHENVNIIEIDFIKTTDFSSLRTNFDVAFYLIHSMSSQIGEFIDLEAHAAMNFSKYVKSCETRHVVYLSGISNSENLSAHLKSRKNVEEILLAQDFHTTVLRAGIIVGSGSASFEIIRDLVEKLPIMITPKWLLTRSQPIAIRDVIALLIGVIHTPECYDKCYDIGGPDILSYKQMLLQFAEVRGLKRIIIILPIMTPRFSSYWLYLVTRTSYNLAVNLVNSMKVETIANENELLDLLNIRPLSYKEAIKKAFTKIEQNQVLSSWKDAINSSKLQEDLSKQINVPSFGCYNEMRSVRIKASKNIVLDRIWAIGGNNGWYYANVLWKFRGFVDKMAGGVGLRRGRTHPSRLHTGDALDFWRVLYADKEEGRLLLFAEMKMPGEAWLEFTMKTQENEDVLYQTATFRPKGLIGRAYWLLTKPLHYFILNGMLQRIAKP